MFRRKPARSYQAQQPKQQKTKQRVAECSQFFASRQSQQQGLDEQEARELLERWLLQVTLAAALNMPMGGLLRGEGRMPRDVMMFPGIHR